MVLFGGTDDTSSLPVLGQRDRGRGCLADARLLLLTLSLRPHVVIYTSLLTTFGEHDQDLHVVTIDCSFSYVDLVRHLLWPMCIDVQ